MPIADPQSSFAYLCSRCAYHLSAFHERATARGIKLMGVHAFQLYLPGDYEEQGDSCLGTGFPHWPCPSPSWYGKVELFGSSYLYLLIIADFSARSNKKECLFDKSRVALVNMIN